MTSVHARPRVPLFTAAARNLVISASGAVLTYLSFMLVAYVFGATAHTDVFMFASSFVLVAAALITTLLGTMFLPLYIRLQHGPSGEQRAAAFADAILLRLVCVALAPGLMILVCPVWVFAWVSKFSTAVLMENQRILMYFSVVFVLAVLNEFFRVLLQAREAYVPAALSMVVQPVVNVVCVVGLVHRLGYESLALAAALSRVLQTIFLVGNVRRRGLRVWPRWVPCPDMQEFWRVARPYWMGSFVTTASLFFFDYVASGLPSGHLTALAFAQRIYLLPISLLVMPVVEVLNTRLSTLHARDDSAGFRALYTASVTVMLLTMLPIGLLTVINAQAITQLLLARGAYSQESLHITSQSLTLYALAIPCLALFAINGRIALVLRKSRLSSLLSAIGQITSAVVVWMMVSHWGYIGLSGARLLMEVVYFLPMGFWVVRYYLPAIDFGSIGVEFARIAGAALGAYAVQTALGHYVQWQALPALGYLVLTTLVYVLLYGVFCVSLRLASLQTLRAAFAARRRGSA